jgi:hypothetical protein
MTRNGDELVRLFNEIDDWLKVRSGDEGDDGFVARLVRVRDHAVIRPYVGFLNDVARLRNAIVHDRRYPIEIVAGPRGELIARLRQVRDPGACYAFRSGYQSSYRTAVSLPIGDTR